MKYSVKCMRELICPFFSLLPLQTLCLYIILRHSDIFLASLHHLVYNNNYFTVTQNSRQFCCYIFYHSTMFPTASLYTSFIS